MLRIGLPRFIPSRIHRFLLLAVPSLPSALALGNHRFLQRLTKLIHQLIPPLQLILIRPILLSLRFLLHPKE